MKQISVWTWIQFGIDEISFSRVFLCFIKREIFTYIYTLYKRTEYRKKKEVAIERRRCRCPRPIILPFVIVENRRGKPYGVRRIKGYRIVKVSEHLWKFFSEYIMRVVQWTRDIVPYGYRAWNECANVRRTYERFAFYITWIRDYIWFSRKKQLAFVSSGKFINNLLAWKNF